MQRQKFIKLLTVHIALCAVFAIIWYLNFWVCPFKMIFHVACPCCGTTRAWQSLFCGQPIKAFEYNPFFWAFPPIVFYYVHKESLFKNFNPKLWQKIALYVFLFVMTAVYIFRVFILKIAL